MLFKNLKKALNEQKGFTLIELIVIIAILGILSAIVGVNMLNYIQTGRMKTCMAECMECVASAQTLLVEHNSYGTDITPEKIIASAGVDGEIPVFRYVNNEVTHLYYTKGDDTYVYCRYYDELNTNSAPYGHLYDYVDTSDPSFDKYDADAVAINKEAISTAINQEDISVGINDLYTYISRADIPGDELVYNDDDYDDSDIPYDEEDPTQDDETVEPTTTTTTTTTKAPSVDSSDGTLYKAVLYYIYNRVSTNQNTEDLSGEAIVCFPKSGDALSMDDLGSGDYFAYTHDGYYYVFDYSISGNSSNIVIQDLHNSSIGSSFTLSGGYNNYVLKLYCSDAANADFDTFLAAWEEEGFKDFIDIKVENILSTLISQGSLLAKFADTRSSAQSYTNSTRPSSESDGTIIYNESTSTYQVYLSFADNDSWPAGWYDLPEDSTIISNALYSNSNYNGTYTLY